MTHVSFGTFVFSSFCDVSGVSLGTASSLLRRSISQFLTCPNCTRKFGRMLWEAHNLIHLQVASLISGRSLLFASGEPRKKYKSREKKYFCIWFSVLYVMFGFPAAVFPELTPFIYPVSHWELGAGLPTQKVIGSPVAPNQSRHTKSL